MRRNGLAGDSTTVAGWTVLSRLAGFVRVAVVAAVLGPSYLGNTFLATNFLPTLALELVTGSLLATLLVPALVRALDARGVQAAGALAGGVLGVVLVVYGLVALLAIAAGPLLLGLLALGVEDPAVADDQLRVGWLFLAMFMPQVPLFGLVQIATAVQSAHGRFGLAAAAPIVESLGVIATMLASVALYGTGATISDIGQGQLLLLGLGSTGAVVAHAALQWYGAWRAGVALVPRAGWRHPAVRALLARTRETLGQSAVSSARTLAALVVANAVPGGVVALRVALNFVYLPIMAGARPVAIAFQPALARLHHAGAALRFHAELVWGLALVVFLALPAAVAYAVLAEPLAGAAAFGDMAGEAGTALLAATLLALAPSVVGDSLFLMVTHAAYAREDARTPLVATTLGAVVAAAGMGATFLLADGTATLLGLGAALSAGSAVSAWWLYRTLRRDLPAAPDRLGPAVARAGLASALMAAPAWLIAAGLGALLEGELAALVATLAAAVAGATTFLAAQRVWRSPELAFFASGLRRAA
jgi:putative peptidoglycan lipid II flippase